MENRMETAAPKQHGFARRAAIAVCWFFLIMLLLAYLSRAISDSLKARVSIGYTSSSVLDESIEGTGEWLADETQFYSTYYTRRIVRLYVKPGETIKAGDPLFSYDVSTVSGGKTVSDKKVRAAKQALEKAEKALESAEDPAYAESVVENAKQALAYAEFTFAQTYALQNGGVVLSTFSGTLIKCDLREGKASSAGESGFEIAPNGLVFAMTVPKKEAERIRIGDAVTLYADGKEEEATLSVDYTESDDENGSIRIVCAGDGGKARMLNARQDWMLKKQSARYRQTIPVSALRQSGVDSYYVLLLNEKDTILGAQLIAKKQDVVLIAHDSKFAAIEECLSERDRLVTKSTKELKDGDYVVLDDAN